VARALTALLAVLALAGAGCGSKSTSDLPTGKTIATAPTTQTQTQKPKAAPGACKQVSAPKPRNPGKNKKPTAPLAAGKKWSLTFQTNCGDFTVALDLKTAPKASASLVALAKKGYFDNTLFHRIVPGFVIQGGDPTQSGQGGPGYTTVDKPPASATYPVGTFAMAKAGNEPKGAGGSQFFVVTGTDSQLTPDYAVVGKVTKGLDVTSKIGKLGDPSTEQPTAPVVISGVTVSSS
jgi:peptidyl-prolyl cis-trans isomerase B (cyclophilin B)